MVRPGGAVVVADVGVAGAGDLAEVTAALRAGGREAQLPHYADGHALEIDVWEPWLRARLRRRRGRPALGARVGPRRHAPVTAGDAPSLIAGALPFRCGAAPFQPRPSPATLAP